MKKFLALILALAMVACMSVTAFAADGTTTLTVEVPDNTPSYTFHYPSEVKLEYGKTDKQEVGGVYVTDVKNYKDIFVMMPYTDLVNINDNTDTIPLTLYYYSVSYGDRKLKHNGLNENNGSPYLYRPSEAGQYNYDSDGYLTQPMPVKAQVSDWSGATAGATYKATITYSVGVN